MHRVIITWRILYYDASMWCRGTMVTSLALLVLMVSLNEGAIISQSSIKDCSWGDNSEPASPGGDVCSKKMLISMVLGSGQGNTESLHANIDKAYEEGNTEMSVLKKPFRIELRKTPVVASYRAHLIGTANALPKETSISKAYCVDDFYANPRKLPCGMQYDDKKRPVWDSQGFCCRCDEGFESSYNKRGGHSCDFGNVIQGRGSAHCMKMDDLWYDVFSLEMPMMQYRITLDVLELQGIAVNNATGSKSVNWTLVSTFHLSPSRTIGRSKNGRVIAEVQGSLLGSKAIKDLSAKRLLIPSVRMWPKKKRYPPPYTNGPNDWMLVDTAIVQLMGTECNKIGVQYTGFRRQPGRCQTQKGFCFHNQPLQLWEFDNELRKKKKSGRYMIHNYGKVHHGSHPNNNSFILKFLHDDLHNSFVTLRIDASAITFVRSVSSGRIVETYTVPFTATVGHGALTVEVGNTGEVSSEYSVSVVKCTSGLHNMAAKTLTLNPGEVQNTSFTLRSGDTDGGGKECEVQLFDSNFNLLDTVKINIKVGAACLCFGLCGCVCDDDKKGIGGCSLAGPPTLYKPGPIGLTVFVMLLESIGAHGFIGFFGSILILLGFIKLSFGGILCCRKTKAQEHTQRMIEKGVPPKSPLLVQCSGECRGAKAAKARYMRKVRRLRAIGKSPHRLDDWRNTSFECHCKTELTDIRMIHVVRTVCFFYFCFFLPFIMLGRWIVWRIFKDTEEKKTKAEQAVLLKAKKKGNLEKYGVIDLATELKKYEEETEKGAEERNRDDGKSVVTQEPSPRNTDLTPTAKGKEEAPGKGSHKGSAKAKTRKPKTTKEQQSTGGRIERGKQEKTSGLEHGYHEKQPMTGRQRKQLGIGGVERGFHKQSASPRPQTHLGAEQKARSQRHGRVERREKGERGLPDSRGREVKRGRGGDGKPTVKTKSGHRKRRHSSASPNADSDLSVKEEEAFKSANEEIDVADSHGSRDRDTTTHLQSHSGSSIHSSSSKPSIQSAHESSLASHKESSHTATDRSKALGSSTSDSHSSQGTSCTQSTSELLTAQSSYSQSIASHVTQSLSDPSSSHITSQSTVSSSHSTSITDSPSEGNVATSESRNTQSGSYSCSEGSHSGQSHSGQSHSGHSHSEHSHNGQSHSGHSHSGHSHSEHSHNGQSHSGHSHSGQSHSEHSHNGQSHSGHSHSGQSHSGQSLCEQSHSEYSLSEQSHSHSEQSHCHSEQSHSEQSHSHSEQSHIEQSHSEQGHSEQSHSHSEYSESQNSSSEGEHTYSDSDEISETESYEPDEYSETESRHSSFESHGHTSFESHGHTSHTTGSYSSQ